MSLRPYRPAVLGLPAMLLAAFAPGQALAAQSYDNCTGFIDTLPATITTQGTWCLNKNLATSITNGAAIVIATNNVTIDCNDFKIGGLAAGDGSLATGIAATSVQNATVRRCGVRGFARGIWLTGGAGHLLEDNRLDNNLFAGIVVTGEGSRIERNRVYDTGGSLNASNAYGIQAAGDILDNTVAGVFALGASPARFGIQATGAGATVRGNLVRGLEGPAGQATGIQASASGVSVLDNRISAATASAGTGLAGTGTQTFCSQNTVLGFATAYSSCEYSAGNLPEVGP